ncbi:MAG: hypothetical protein MUP09_03905 [Thiovulaceae bacterium]|nr:hypothetical protein [Sulfurimonadaceae bacterium]
MFDKIDANSDGLVDKKEYMAFTQKRYAAFDSNDECDAMRAVWPNLSPQWHRLSLTSMMRTKTGS